MKTYDVALPITGVIYVSVKAESPEEAIQKALESNLTTDQIESWDVHEHIVQGNVFYGDQNDAEVVSEYDEDEE